MATGIDDDRAAEPTDEVLMEAVRDGDDSAFAPLMHRWELPVKAFVARLGVPGAEVEDVAQEAFARLYAKRASFRPGARFKPWLLTIAGNLARNRHRWRTRHPAESLDAILEAGGVEPGGERAEGAAAGRGAELDAERLAVGVRRAVADLPVALREAVVCVELQEMSHAEAAAVMACTPKAVETRLYRARAALRESLRAFFARQ
jgi:RNA polymerase sigma-70 factor (ECF subfamily)